MNNIKNAKSVKYQVLGVHEGTLFIPTNIILLLTKALKEVIFCLKICIIVFFLGVCGNGVRREWGGLRCLVTVGVGVVFKKKEVEGDERRGEGGMEGRGRVE